MCEQEGLPAADDAAEGFSPRGAGRAMRPSMRTARHADPRTSDWIRDALGLPYDATRANRSGNLESQPGKAFLHTLDDGIRNAAACGAQA